MKMLTKKTLKKEKHLEACKNKNNVLLIMRLYLKSEKFFHGKKGNKFIY